MKLSKFFSKEDLQRIEEAVKKAESKTSGEIVPCFVDSSDEYDESLWRSVTLGMSIGAGVSIAEGLIIPSWTPPDLLMHMAAALGIGLVFGLIIEFIPPLKRIMIGKRKLEWRVQQSAEHFFLENEVFKTKERTGVIILLSLFEKQIRILPDNGISDKIKTEQWQEVVSLIASYIRKGQQAEGIIAAIEKTGNLLVDAGFKKSASDTNELRDTLRS